MEEYQDIICLRVISPYKLYHKVDAEKNALKILGI